MNKYQQADLERIVNILGATRCSLWPFFEFDGTRVVGYTAGADLTPAETAGAAEALEDDFSPARLSCGLYSYWFHPTGDHHLAGADHANYSHGDGTVDSAFSVGAWVWPVDLAAARCIMSKYDSAGGVREWSFRLNASGIPQLELYDESVDTTEIATASSALQLYRPQHVVATYDGGETAPVIHIYVDSTDLNPAGGSTETGAYVAMENTAAPLLIGASGVTALPTEEWHGRIALPFLTGKALTAAEVDDLYRTTRPMVLGK